MEKWVYIDDLDSVPNSKHIYCDTRDFHLSINNMSSEIDRDIIRKWEKENNESNLFNRSEILGYLKSLECASGGRASWRFLSFKDNENRWIKYIRFINIPNTEHYICYTDNIFFLSREIHSADNVTTDIIRY